MSDAQQLALIRREAKIERYRRDFDSYFNEQCLVRPKVGPVMRPQPRLAMKVIELGLSKQLKEKGWIRLCEYKARQWGGSTHGVGRACHRAFLNENVSALIVPQDDGTAANLFNMAQLNHEAMDADIKPVRRYLTKQQIVLENPDPKTRGDFPGLRSRIEVQSATNIHAGVGTTRNWLHLSEMCRFRNIKELKGSIIPAIPMQPGTAMIYESAPFGFGEGRDEFKATCEAARSGKSPFLFIAIYWWMVEEYSRPLDKGEKMRVSATERQLINQVKRLSKKELGLEISLTFEQLKWRREMIDFLSGGDQAVGEQLFDQQFCSDFESSWESLDTPVFSRYKLQQMNVTHVRGPRRRCNIIQDKIIDTEDDAPLWIWEDPIPGEVYDMGVDPGPGLDGGANSAAQVFKRSNNEQVAEFIGLRKTLDFAPDLVTLGMYYNCAQIGAEIENVGYVVDEALKKMSYPNMYQWRYRNHVVPKLSNLSGWKTQADSKKILVETANHLLDHDLVIIHSARLLGEMRQFMHYISDFGNDLYFAANGNDDAVMAYMITLVIADDERSIELPPERDAASAGRPTTLKERERKLLEGIEKSSAFMDDPERAAVLLTDEQLKAYRWGGLTLPDHDDDPWSKLANAMKGR